MAPLSDIRSFWATPGARTFALVWAGQLVSNLGSAMTTFGLAVWVFDRTGSASQLAFIVMASRLPMLLMSPFAGALVDRWDRRKAMMLADAGAALGTFVTMILLLTDSLQIWHLYATLGFSGLFEAFQFPAYSAAVTLLIPGEHHARASGFVQLAGAVARVGAPAAAGALVLTAGLTPLFVIDVATFLFALATLALVRFPEPARDGPRLRGVGGLLAEARVGLDFVIARPALLILMLSFVMVNFAFAFQGVLLIPLLLNMTSEATAGVVVSVGAAGLAVGSLVLGAWGGPKDRIVGTYAPIAAMGVGLVLIGATPWVWMATLGLLLMHGTHPIAGGSSQAIWQAKVPADLQGRVFAVRQISAVASSPIAFLLAGVLADRVFEPLMVDPDNLLGLLGSGPGRGIGLMFMLSGATTLAVVAWALQHPRIRGLDAEIPDAGPAGAHPQSSPPS